MEVTVSRYAPVCNSSCHPSSGGLENKKESSTHPQPIYWLHTIRPTMLRDRGWGGEKRRGRGVEGVNRQCCQGLLLDSMVISQREGAKETKRKFTGVVLSGRALNWETHRRWDCQCTEKRPFREKVKGELFKSQAFFMCVWGFQFSYTQSIHFVLGSKSSLVHGHWLW